MADYHKVTVLCGMARARYQLLDQRCAGSVEECNMKDIAAWIQNKSSID